MTALSLRLAVKDLQKTIEAINRHLTDEAAAASARTSARDEAKALIAHVVAFGCPATGQDADDLEAMDLGQLVDHAWQSIADAEGWERT